MVRFLIEKHILEIKADILSNFNSVNTISSLVSFQSCNKYLFTLINQRTMKEMGRIVSNKEKKEFEKVRGEYKKKLSNFFVNEINDGNLENTYLHMFGHFKNKVSINEKNKFLELLAEFRQGKKSRREVIEELKRFLDKYPEEYISSQTILK